jgi:hypothetical protein
MDRLSGPSGVVLSDPEFESPAPREGFCFCTFFCCRELSLCVRLLLRVGLVLHLHQCAKTSLPSLEEREAGRSG